MALHFTVRPSVHVQDADDAAMVGFTYNHQLLDKILRIDLIVDRLHKLRNAVDDDNLRLIALDSGLHLFEHRLAVSFP